MQGEIHTNEDQLVTEFIERMNGAGDGQAAREAYREGFKRLRSQLEMYPVSGRHASAVFESAAKTATRMLNNFERTRVSSVTSGRSRPRTR